MVLLSLLSLSLCYELSFVTSSSVVRLESTFESDRLAKKDKYNLILALFVYGHIISCVNSSSSRWLLSVLCSDIGLLKDATTTTGSLDNAIGHNWRPPLAHHQGQVRELVLNVAVWEAHARNKLLRHVDHSTNLNWHTLAFLVELCLWLLKLTFVATDEESSHMMAVWILPRCLGLHALRHLLKLVKQVFRLTGLAECILEDLAQFALVCIVTLHVDSKEDSWLVALWDASIFGIC